MDPAPAAAKPHKEKSCSQVPVWMTNPPHAQQIYPVHCKFIPCMANPAPSITPEGLGGWEAPSILLPDRWLIRCGNQRRPARRPERSPRGRGRMERGPPHAQGTMRWGQTMPERLRRAKRGQTLLIPSSWKQQPVYDRCHHPAPKSRDPPLPLGAHFSLAWTLISPGRGMHRHRMISPQKGSIYSPCTKPL